MTNGAAKQGLTVPRSRTIQPDVYLILTLYTVPCTRQVKSQKKKFKNLKMPIFQKQSQLHEEKVKFLSL